MYEEDVHVWMRRMCMCGWGGCACVYEDVHVCMRVCMCV